VSRRTGGNSERGPAAEGLAIEPDAFAGEDLGLPVVGQVADEAVVANLGDQPRGCDAAVLQGGRQRGDNGLGERVCLANVFAADQPYAAELGALVGELLADFLADVSPLFPVGQDFGRIDDLFVDRQVIGDARRTRLLQARVAAGEIISRRSGVVGLGGGRFLCRIEEFELRGIQRLAGLAEDAPAKGVNGLLEDGDLGRLALDHRVALRDFVDPSLPFLVLHLREMQ
jgi:hypothetical protein